MEEAFNECTKDNAFIAQVNNERELEALNLFLLEFPIEQKFWIGLIKVRRKYTAVIRYNLNNFITASIYPCATDTMQFKSRFTKTNFVGRMGKICQMLRIGLMERQDQNIQKTNVHW